LHCVGQLRLSVAAGHQERAFAAAAEQLEAMRRERNTLAEAVAAVAEAVVGGQNATPQHVAEVATRFTLCHTVTACVTL
jgi:hypothetical protein